MQTTNADPAELAKFSHLAHRWWDPSGEFRPLHEINPLRLDWIAGLAPLTVRLPVGVRRAPVCGRRHRQVHSPQDCREARVAANRVEIRVEFQPPESLLAHLGPHRAKHLEGKVEKVKQLLGI